MPRRYTIRPCMHAGSKAGFMHDQLYRSDGTTMAQLQWLYTYIRSYIRRVTHELAGYIGSRVHWRRNQGGTGHVYPHKFYELLIGIQFFTIEI